jgi:hypothetical protein
VVTRRTFVSSPISPSVTRMSPDTEFILSASILEFLTRKSPDVDFICRSISPPSTCTVPLTVSITEFLRSEP